jgi:bacterioferritin-associated ferredoxin
MYVCICKGITDSDIRSAVHEGASSFRSVSKQLGVSTQCGQCACHAKALVEQTLEDVQMASSSEMFYAA